MKMTKENFAQFRTDLKNAVKQVEEKYGVTITPQRISYNATDFTITLNVENNDKVEVMKANFPEFAKIYGMTFREKTHTYTIINYEPYHKYDVVCKRDDGKIFNFNMSYLKELLGA